MSYGSYRYLIWRYRLSIKGIIIQNISSIITSIFTNWACKIWVCNKSFRIFSYFYSYCCAGTIRRVQYFTNCIGHSISSCRCIWCDCYSTISIYSYRSLCYRSYIYSFKSYRNTVKEVVTKDITAILNSISTAKWPKHICIGCKNRCSNLYGYCSGSTISRIIGITNSVIYSICSCRGVRRYGNSAVTIYSNWSFSHRSYNNIFQSYRLSVQKIIFKNISCIINSFLTIYWSYKVRIYNENIVSSFNNYSNSSRCTVTRI